MAKEIERLHTIIDTIYSDLDNTRYSLFGDEYKPNEEHRVLTYVERLVKIQKGYNRMYDFTAKVLKENEHLKAEIEQLRQNPPKPKSNAGRHSKFNNEQKQQIISMFSEDKLSMGKIAKIMNCSKGLVHKLIHEHDLSEK